MGFGLRWGWLCMQAALDWGGNPWLERAGVTPGSVWQGGDTEAQWGALWSAYSGQPPSERAEMAQAGPLGGQGLAVIPMDLGVSMRPVPARGGCGHGCPEDRRQQGPSVRQHPAWWGCELLRPPLQWTPIPQPMRLEGLEPVAVAGLWDVGLCPADLQALPSCRILTVEAERPRREDTRPSHHRNQPSASPKGPTAS